MLTTILTSIVTAITTMISGLASALVSGFESVFITGTGAEASLSTTGTWIIALLGIALAFGVFRWVMGLARSRS